MAKPYTPPVTVNIKCANCDFTNYRIPVHMDHYVCIGCKARWKIDKEDHHD